MDLIVSGMMFGDEGKGSIIDYLASELCENNLVMVRHSGGCQGLHNVVYKGDTYKFSQLPSGLLCYNGKKIPKTYITNNFIVNLASLIEEIKEISNKLMLNYNEIAKNIHINEASLLVTQYHKFLNQMDSYETKRSSVGTGVSTTAYMSEHEFISIKIKDLDTKGVLKNKLINLREYIFDKYGEKVHKIIPSLENTIENLTKSYDVLKDMGLNVYRDDNILKREKGIKIFESSQGLLLDKDLGTLPDTTYLDTTNKYALKLCNKIYRNIGVSRALLTRHGKGFLKTEDEYLKKIRDINQMEGKFNGSIRYGWFDCVLMRYSKKKLGVKELVLTCIDELFELDYTKICVKYKVRKEVDENKLTDGLIYQKIKGDIYITDINNITPETIEILNRCNPIYLNVGEIKEDNKDKYLKIVERELNLKISTISNGPDRYDKKELRR